MDAIKGEKLFGKNEYLNVYDEVVSFVFLFLRRKNRELDIFG